MRRSGKDGTIPDGWQVVRLGDVCAPPEYGANAAALPFDPDLPRFVRITDINDEGRLRLGDARSAEPAKVLGYELGTGDLLFARSGSVGRTYLYRPEDGPCVFAGYLIRFRPKPEVILPRFVEIYAHSASYYRWVTSMLRVGAQPNINAAEYSSLPIPLPPLPEQRRIAAVLNAIDDAIERTNDAIVATERLRDALLHDLLSHGVPGWHSEWRDVPGLGTIPADWEVVRLGDMAEVRGGKRLPKGSSFATEDTGFPYIRVVDFENRTIRSRAVQFIDHEIRESIKNYTICSADVYISIAGTIGLVGTIPAYLDGANLTENAAKIVISSASNLFNKFLMYYLDSLAGQSQILLKINKLGQPKLALEQIRTIKIPLPSLPEQEIVAGVLESVDRAVERAEDERDGLRALKASTADALLSGRVRIRS